MNTRTIIGSAHSRGERRNPRTLSEAFGPAAVWHYERAWRDPDRIVGYAIAFAGIFGLVILLAEWIA